MTRIDIDGSRLEGGGQILRTVLGLSAATGTPVRIRNIRKRRSNPGLAAQHLAGVRAAARTCDAELKGAKLRSTELQFTPGALDPPASISAKVGTAGSVTLVLQGLVTALAAAGRTVEVSVSGGTHVKWSPTTDYFRRVFAWHAGRLGLSVVTLDEQPGFYPKGGGSVRLEVRPGDLSPVQLRRRGELRAVTVRSLAHEQLKGARVAERQVEGVRKILKPDRERAEYCSSLSVGTAVLATAEYDNCRLGASALGERGKPSEAVGAEAGARLRAAMESGACLDRHMADQILPYMALAEGESCVRVEEVTGHCRTNIWAIEQLLPVHFEVDEGQGLITCR